MSEYKKEEWRVKQPAADIRALAEQFSISPILAHIIVNREITEPDAVACYLSDDLAYTHDPALMKDMDKGCQIMKEKIRAGKKIRIISDYDVDGITSNYILYQGLQKAGADVSYDIPHRIMDGYGMNVRLVEAAYADGVDTIITCDNGIAAETAVTRAKELGMTVIVTDHHEVPCEVTENGEKNYLYVNADAVVDPHRPDCAYPYKDLCGAGVAYKFIRHLYRVMELPWEGEDAYMDILALGTVCDIMPLTDENRIFVKRGLRRLTNSTNLGINALKKALGLDGKPIEVHHLSFRIGPSLNSTGRLESAKEGVELLLTDDPARAESLAQDMAKLNELRKEMTDRGVRAATDWVRKDIRMIPTEDGVKEKKIGDDKVIVLYMPGIHESIAGLIASKLKEAFYRPTLVFTDAENGQGLKGSGRSIETYNMFDKLCEHKELFVKVGGHPMAGTQFSGFKYAKADLYHGAPMVLVPPRFDDIELLGRVKDLLTPAGFGSYSVTTAEQHDEMIAFTSQLAHVASNAYIKSPTAKKHKGFSAGSYKDMTRVAWLAPHMWAELFLENRDFLLKEIDCYIEHLSQYKAAMEQNDEEELIRLLDEGKKRKEEVDG